METRRARRTRSARKAARIRSTVMTSNRPIEDRGRLVEDVASATAILDRSLQHAEIITITGRSYRLKGKAACREGAKADNRTGSE